MKRMPSAALPGLRDLLGGARPFAADTLAAPPQGLKRNLAQLRQGVRHPIDEIQPGGEWAVGSSQCLIWPNNLATMWRMKKVKIGEFRDRASEMIRRAAEGETIVILNRDREVAKLVPFATRSERPSRLIGCLAGTAEIRGDIEAPIAPPETWFQDRS